MSSTAERRAGMHRTEAAGACSTAAAPLAGAAASAVTRRRGRASTCGAGPRAAAPDTAPVATARQPLPIGEKCSRGGGGPVEAEPSLGRERWGALPLFARPFKKPPSLRERTPVRALARRWRSDTASSGRGDTGGCGWNADTWGETEGGIAAAASGEAATAAGASSGGAVVAVGIAACAPEGRGEGVTRLGLGRVTHRKQCRGRAHLLGNGARAA
jgi:hypothetical protein